MKLSRRGLLAGGAAGGAMVIAWYLSPRAYENPMEPLDNERTFGGWLKISTDGIVTVALPQLEMGQGISTILPQIIAVELGADWRQIAVEPVPINAAFSNTVLAEKWATMWASAFPSLASEPGNIRASNFAENNRFTATADGTALAAYETPCREAAAAARAMLAQEAADRWDVSWEECEVKDGLVTHQGKRFTFADLVEDASERDIPDPAPLRPEPAFEMALPIVGDIGSQDQGVAFPRLDLPAKVDGSYQFAGDIRLPDLLYASIMHGPMGRESRLKSLSQADGPSFGASARIVKGENWVAAVAKNWWKANSALSNLRPKFTTFGKADSLEIEEQLAKSLDKGESYRIFAEGDEDERLKEPDIAIRYDVMPALHATVETSTATARYVDGTLELWIATQAPEQARIAAADAIGISVEDVVLYPMAAGGSFDRRLEHDHAAEVAVIAKEVGKPVQLIYSRWQEHLHSLPRAPAASVLSAKVAPGSNGSIDSFLARIATPATALEFGARLFDGGTRREAIASAHGEGDSLVMEGMYPQYAIPNLAGDHVPTTLNLPTGRLRGNSHGVNAFFLESFIDEVARKYFREPLSYRIEMLGHDPRMVACLQQVARLAEWDAGADQSGKGLACHRMGDLESGGRIACIAIATRDAGGVRVSKLTATVDIGRIVNLDIARQQIEGGLVFGMSLALGSATGYFGGLPSARGLADLDLPILNDCPEIVVEFVVSEAEPFDPGELGAVVAAPAIANALFSATGLRFRRLPLISEGI